MIITQVLTSLLRGDFGSLDDLPANVRNDALLDLAKLAGEGKLSGEYFRCIVESWHFFSVSSGNAGESLHRIGAESEHITTSYASER